MKKNKKLIMGMAIVLALATVVVGATFAWYTATDNALNKMNTRKLIDGSVEIFEVFPDDKIEFGATLQKEVGATNTGDIPVLIRMSFEELLVKLNAPLAGTSTAPTAGRYDTDSGFIPALVNTGAYVSPYVDLDTLFPDVTGYDPSDITVKAYYDLSDSAYKVVAWKQITAVGEFNGANQKVTLKFNPAGNGGLGLVYDVEYWEAETASANYLWAEVDNADRMPGWFEAFTSPRDDTDFSGTSIVAKTDDTNNLIKLNFSTNLATSMAAGTWYYNMNDGWFYYMGKVDSGTTTPFLLSSVSMGAAPSDPLIAGLYKYLNFDLDVKMQAIQNLTGALTASNGWDLDNLAFAGANAALITALTDFCS